MDRSGVSSLALAAAAIALLVVAPVVATADDWSLSFDGVNDFAAIRDLTFSYSSLTIEAWVYYFGTGGSDEIVGIATDSGDVYFQLERKATTGLLFDPAGEGCRLTASEVLPAEEWHHVAVVYENPAVVIYVDGVPRATSSCLESRDIMGVDLMIGKETPEWVYADFWFGYIDELRIWTVGRTQPEIMQWMHTGLSGSEPGLLGYWRFNEGSGQVIHDSSVNTLDGHLGSTPIADENDPSWGPGVQIASPVEGSSWGRVKALYK